MTLLVLVCWGNVSFVVFEKRQPGVLAQIQALGTDQSPSIPGPKSYLSAVEESILYSRSIIHNNMHARDCVKLHLQRCYLAGFGVDK